MPKTHQVHRDIKSANILLGKNWEPKIADFGLSRIQHTNNQASTLNTSNVAGTDLYLDPEYLKTGKLKKESDIYSFGVVLFEILCGKLAYDKHFDNDKGLPSTVRRFQNEGNLKEIIDPRVMEETDINSFHLNRGPNQDSLDAFLKIAYQCLAETGAKRPKMEIIIAELQTALDFQVNNKDKLKISLEVIKLATQNFSDHNLIGKGSFGKVYKGEVIHANQHHVIAAKRLDRKWGQGEPEFLKELEILLEYKNDNVIGLVGYCDDGGEKIIVYEYASHKSLDLHLSNTDLTWMKRLKICIDVAIGLDFFHGAVVTPDVVIHRDIKSSNILLTVDWKAKLSDFGLSLICPINQEMDHVFDLAVGTFGYCDPSYAKTGFLTKESDMYSLGMVLFEILCGRLAYEAENYDYLRLIVREHISEGKLGDIVYKDIKEQVVPESLTTYSRIAYRCLDEDREKRPTTGEVVLQLKQALEFQEDHEIWEPKLPRDYKEIIQMSKSPDLYSAISKKDLYNMLCKGILLQDGKEWFSLGSNGKRNAMISARKFSYINRSPHKWQSVSESRFQKVAEMLDISNLMIKIKTTTKYLSPDVGYGVYLVFKFCNPKELSSKPMYVNLKYRKGSETFHAYFATWRGKDWMMIELDRFINQTEVVVFKFLLESVSPHYYADDAIYVEGIEFRAINNVEHKEIEKSKEVQQVLKSNFKNADQVQEFPSKSEEIFKKSNDGEKLLPLSEVNGKKHLMLSPRTTLYNFSHLKLYKSTPSAESRFQEVVELLPQQVFFINCTIKAKDLSPDTIYVCYLVFKLSEECQGFHCPVEVRDLLHRENKEAEIVYFKTPTPWNLHDITQAPKQREDGWMELNVWKSNSDHAPKNDLPVNLKFRSYEGTMSGLIVCGLEFRPM